MFDTLIILIKSEGMIEIVYLLEGIRKSRLILITYFLMVISFEKVGSWTSYGPDVYSS
jgi:hypothetical protein